MCELLSVSAAGYYEWRGRPLSARTEKDAKLAAEIAIVYDFSRRTYGRPHIHAKLAKLGRRIGPKRVATLMKSLQIAGILCGRATSRTSKPKKAGSILPSSSICFLGGSLVGR